MFRKFNHHKNEYLVKISDDKVLFEIITQHEVENWIAERYKYLLYQGEVMHEIVYGVSLNHTHDAAFTSECKYLEFKEFLLNQDLITEEELIGMVPMYIYGDYNDPFKI